MNLPIGFRSFLNQTLLSFGVHEVQARQEAFARIGGFDLTSWEPKKAKAYADPRPQPPDVIVVHVTDVAGGFGVSKRRVLFFEDLLFTATATDFDLKTLARHVPEEVIAQLPERDTRSTSLFVKDTRKAAQRLALWERLKDTAYHQVGSANGDSLAIHDVMRWSWHGNGGNKRGCGWALDCSHKQVLDHWMVETGKVSLRGLIHRMPEHPIVVVPHRVFSADRRVDTNARKNMAGVWLNVVKPVVAEFDHVSIGYGEYSKKGRPVPIDWDEEALFDWKGRKL